MLGAMLQPLRILWCAIAHIYWHELMDKSDVAVFRLDHHETVQVRSWRCARCRRAWTEGSAT